MSLLKAKKFLKSKIYLHGLYIKLEPNEDENLNPNTTVSSVYILFMINSFPTGFGLVLECVASKGLSSRETRS